jgi:Zn-dependent peptidase ImmA (M78 family)
VRGTEDAAACVRLAAGAAERLEAVDLAAVAAYLDVVVLSWRPEDDGLKGALIRGARAVFVNASLNAARRRFIAAHEFGHLALGHRGDFYCPAAERSPQEVEANRFAAALLMPAALVRALWLKLEGVRPGARARLVAERLGVSREALGYRLAALGLAARAASAGRGR